MDCDALRDDQWERIRGFVPGGTRGKRGPRTNNRLFLDALLWMARSGGRWRDLPERLGDYRSVKRRYYRWIEMGVLDEMLAMLAREADLEWLMIDSTIVRAHQHAAGARKVKGGPDAQGLGRSRGGLSTKIHAATEALGLPVRLIASPGQRNDIAFAHDLVDGIQAAATIADKGYDADHLCDKITETGADVVIPPKRNRKLQRPYDADLYKERNRIERFFSKLKQFRRVATRYDKLLANFMGFVKLAAIAIWLK
ncbi:IS5 family transposase [Rhizobium leguminosarum bv. viciae]|uniref:IS5 family transposase n=1 Tax=Rhizobium leguminosarum TaxID=384 RepID=UPI000D369D41|nr:IS5 family transposase [Rhizobium leguminosarum]MBY5345719.1 IS5 family transposase [Rhizobium leguminosarum]MBY5482792.1 IS5 family transposase [Rhizobium leguminosarum]MDX5999996.1 IS5 family transposase [Rhizobium leguminosarum]NKK54243.1 IS5 family transposase [Rhizobium leguminosarum bv. viciae]PUB65731.1 IS5 family transposase [Rhizobium leguminosarum bv. viciae USDA 2370]